MLFFFAIMTIKLLDVHLLEVFRALSHTVLIRLCSEDLKAEQRRAVIVSINWQSLIGEEEDLEWNPEFNQKQVK